MNVIGLTGRNMQSMADVAEQLLAGVTASGHQVAICLYIEDVVQAVALRRNAIGFTEIWRIGQDWTRPDLDRAQLVDCTLCDTDPAQLREQVSQRLQRLLRLIDLCRGIPAALSATGAPPHRTEISA